MKNKFFVTTAIDYTNDVIHIGHAYEKILADSLARFCREKLGRENVLFTVGTDEHGTTNEKAAKARGVDVKIHTNEISEKDKAELDSLNISYDRFIRTTDPDHIKTAQEVFTGSYNAGDIYKAKYQGLYCEGCESYKTLTELDENGRCPNHKTREIQKVEEENYFFKWSKYSGFLKELISSDTLKITPHGKKNEMLGFIEQGINDIPVTRPKYKVGWGIECPVDAEQVIYVWFDALINYYTEGTQKEFWNKDTHILHVVGKDIARWHTLLWPAMLKSADLHLPDEVYVHAFMSLDGEKISKSLGNVILPSDLVKKYGADAVRYYMLKHGPAVEDSNISVKHLEEVYNADLANGLGNLAARVAKLCEKWNVSCPGQPDIDWDGVWQEPINDRRPDLVLSSIWDQIRATDKHINENTPWKISDESKAKDILSWEAVQVLEIGLKLRPFLPSTSEKIVGQFSANPIRPSESLFPRI